jgi:hypothetical protein
MVTKTDYPKDEVNACLSVLIELMTTLGRGRTASHLIAPAQIPACRFSAPGSSMILATVIRHN